MTGTGAPKHTGYTLRRKRHNRRLGLIGIIGVTLFFCVFLVTQALREQILFFKTPTEIVTEGLAPNERVRIGGLVKNGSVLREGKKVNFTVTDTANDLPVTYTGIVPDLFAEGQGVVAEGQIGPDGLFIADTVLAKHDENYVPKEVVAALKEQGVWEGDEDGAYYAPKEDKGS